MIKHFIIENFKAFAEPTIIDLDELLVVAGSNSGGKSTIIQSLLLLAQTLENPRPDVALDLGGKFIQFAEFSEIVYGRPAPKNAEFTIGFDVEINEPDFLLENFIDEYIMKRDIRTSQRLISEKTPKTINTTRLRVTFASDRTGMPLIKNAQYEKSINGLGTISLSFTRERGTKYRRKIALISEVNVNRISSDQILEKFNRTLVRPDTQTGTRSSRYSSSNELYGRASFQRALEEYFRKYGLTISQVPLIGNELEKIFKNIHRYKIEPEELQTISLDIIRVAFQEGLENSYLGRNPFDHFLLSQLLRSQVADMETYWEGVSFNSIFGETVKEIRGFLRRIKYIGPLRAKPERAYLAVGSPIDIGNAGENAVSILWLYQNEKVQNKTSIGGKIFERKLVLAVQDWLQEFGIAYSFHITKPKRVIYQAELESAPGSDTMVTMADVGFGVSQLLPVIVACLRAPKGSTLILEQPEIHLHPKLQGKLADFLACMVELGKKVIVETHSEHLINMLRLRIVQDKTDDLKNKVGIIFVRNSQQKRKSLQVKTRDTSDRGSYVEQLKVDEFGKIINWPPDFFPESTNLNEEILKAMMNKFSEGK